MPPVTQVTHKQVYEGPITRSCAKVLQKEVNLLLAEINFNIFENIILHKMLYICITKGYTRWSCCWSKGEKMVYIEAETTHHLADSTDQ